MLLKHYGTARTVDRVLYRVPGRKYIVLVSKFMACYGSDSQTRGHAYYTTSRDQFDAGDYESGSILITVQLPTNFIFTLVYWK